MIEIGDQVRYSGGETFQTNDITSGIYTLYNTDDYMMCGFVEVKDSLNRIFVVNADLLEAVN